MTLSELRQAPRPTADADFVHGEGFALMERMAAALAGSGLVPEEYRAEVREDGRVMKNPAAVSNCMMALCAARRLNLDPFSVMQGLRVTDGGPTWSDGLLLAGLQGCGRFTMPCIGLTDEAAIAEHAPAARGEQAGRCDRTPDERGENERRGRTSDDRSPEALGHGKGDGSGRNGRRGNDEGDNPDATAGARIDADNAQEGAPLAMNGGAGQDGPVHARTADAGRSDKAATDSRHELRCTVRALEKATGRELSVSAMLPRPEGETPTDEPEEREQTALALRRRALLRFCRLYAPDLFPGLSHHACDGDEERPAPRASADRGGNAPRAKVTLEEIARQAKRSREAAQSCAGKTTLPAGRKAIPATPETTCPGEDASPPNDAARNRTMRSEHDAAATTTQSGKEKARMTEAKNAEGGDDGQPTSAPNGETPTKKTKKEGAPAKVPQP
ncbi:hypothetical protein [uncultured Mailhella sp.]|uniref:hypothetical protein n=1 Tax=uncultured Mailhella sp. TaxID=1981031 RepID=UPI0025F7D879|nr:hypothetical protein [uncultured Mailhella sp.]